MKTLSVLFTVLVSFCLNALADDSKLQEEVTKLKATVERQQQSMQILTEHLSQLNTRLKSVEQIPEIRIPRGVMNNLKILDSGLQQYCLEHKTNACSYADLVGKYVNPELIPSFDGESYTNLRFSLEAPEWRIDTKSGFSLVLKRAKYDPTIWKGLWGENKRSVAATNAPSAQKH